ncbi:MAG: SAM-dependent methyltransferase, partial [Silvibacterium sp.]|nr:SAM-dependent methyltransferase [Silvibacterium sp.]
MAGKTAKTRHSEPQSRAARPPKKPLEATISEPSPSFGEQSVAAVISRRAADRLRAGHVWVYRSDVVSVPDEAPHLLAVTDQRGILLGTALYSAASEIALRLISTELIRNEAEWLDLLDARVRAAI